ncbi:cytochrome b N-terminal domain-containing protein [Heliophilum fasciatum]|uniref:Cytochrome b6 n=1 Tax=Heliophilum fasciatum TaxID=35700 RepID=A0A4R2RVJ7_9FIRM|nr:cytochrome b N-terminal domain-containing protein [Heliophilum fasciatum]MCW2277042.1 cytochrome b6 [Heliophilum fasciatum]TCP68432.1 cytochrome b6 [Heliophilum fasciatum]
MSWMEERFPGIGHAAKEIAEHKVPSHTLNPIYCLGGLTLIAFLVQVLTGIFLAVYYKPTVAEAYASVQMITYEVRFGAIVRSLHHWAANLMIVLCFLHMLRVYYTGAFKKPRELNWVAGCFLLLLSMGLAFTGYLLPYEQLSYWASVIGAETAGSLPVIGPDLKIMMQGGIKVTGEMLSRFYVLHLMVLPAITILFMVAHFIMIRVQGISDPM